MKTVLWILLTLIAGATSAAPTFDIPDVLRPWIPWVLEDQPDRDCPFRYSDPKQRECAWPGVLQLQLDDRSGHFSQSWRLYARGWVPLPGDSRHWPEQVSVDGQATVVLADEDRPVLWLTAGEHTIDGRFHWQHLPDSLAIPADTGLTELRIDGKVRTDLGRDQAGTLWLGEKDKTAGDQANRSVLQVFRRLEDRIPAQLLTRLQLDVSGLPREVLLGPVLPTGFIPQALSASLPARLEPDGRLRLQLRPGRWTIDLSAIHPAELQRVEAVAGEQPWPDEELWAYAPHNELRLVHLDGGTLVDPQQTRLPKAWQSLATRRLRPGQTLVLETLRRGDPEPLPDRLSLQRQLWMDFDGNGYTLHDRLSGTVSAGQRLDAEPPLALGRVAIDGRDRVITHADDSSKGKSSATDPNSGPGSRPTTGRIGVELRQGHLKMEADSRIEGPLRDLPAVGWAHDMQSVSTSLQLPPGWRLFSVSGSDRARTTWVDRWTLLDLFLVLIIAVACARLWSFWLGLLALATLVLTYQEPGAPGWAWLMVLGSAALLRAAPPGRLQQLARMLRNLSLLGLLAVALPFAVQQIRGILHPQLELGTYFQAVSPTAGTSMGTVVGMVSDEMNAVRKLQSPAAQRAKRGRSSYSYFGSGGSIQTQVDPKARVSTGPGLPVWHWRTVRLGWSGPVTQGQELTLRLIPPWANRLLKLLGIILLAGLSAFLIQRAYRESRQLPPVADRPPRKTAGEGAAALLVLLCAAGLLLGHTTPTEATEATTVAPLTSTKSSTKSNTKSNTGTNTATAAFPTPELLSELARRLREPPPCSPQCAQIETLSLSAQAEGLRVQLQIHAGSYKDNDQAGGVMLPLPGDTRIWRIHGVSIDDQPATLLRPRGGHILWIQTPPGRHQVQLTLVPPEGRDTLPLPMELAPHRIELGGPLAADWLLEGVNDNGVPQQQVQLRRAAPQRLGPDNSPAGNDGEASGRSSFPPFLQVRRVLQLGLDWATHTTVTRNPGAQGGVVIAIPLLPGESATSAGARVEDGKVLVALSPGQKTFSWTGTLKPSAAIHLVAPLDQPWAETWRLDASPIWHISSQGIPVIQRHDPQGQWQPEWRPLPGETVTLAITRPKGIGGRTSTIDASHLQLKPGKRATIAKLDIHLRTSQGRQYQLQLPAGASLQKLSLDGKPQAARQRGNGVTLAIEPGSHRIDAEWQQTDGMAWRFDTPALDLGQDSVNSSLQIVVPRDRWLLYTFGPAIGPAVLFWGLLLVILLLAIALGRTGITPLGTWQWLLLCIGLSQVATLQGVIVVAWLLALGARGRMDPSTNKTLHNLIQLGLALLTLLALLVIAEAVQRGLLGSPLMQVGGNGSSGRILNWYLDRSDATLPTATVISVPLLVYRGLMLLWALWLANALLRWLTWGWSNYARGGLWRDLQLKIPKVAVRPRGAEKSKADE